MRSAVGHRNLVKLVYFFPDWCDVIVAYIALKGTKMLRASKISLGLLRLGSHLEFMCALRGWPQQVCLPSPGVLGSLATFPLHSAAACWRKSPSMRYISGKVSGVSPFTLVLSETWVSRVGASNPFMLGRVLGCILEAVFEYLLCCLLILKTTFCHDAHIGWL